MSLALTQDDLLRLLFLRFPEFKTAMESIFTVDPETDAGL